MGFQGFGSLRDEALLSAALFIAAYFISVNVDSQLGNFYIGTVLLYTIYIVSKSFPEIQVKVPGQDILQAGIAAVVVFAAWVFLSMFIWQQTGGSVSFGFTPQNIQQFFSQIGLNTQVPVLSTDPLLRFIIYGQLIPVIESLFFLSIVLVFWAALLKVPVSWHPPGSPQFIRMLWVCVLVGVSGAMFHLSARNLQDIPLLIDMLFFSISAMVVFASVSRIALVGGDSKPNMLKGILFHIFVNTAVLWAVMG